MSDNILKTNTEKLLNIKEIFLKEIYQFKYELFFQQKMIDIPFFFCQKAVIYNLIYVIGLNLNKLIGQEI